MPEPIIVDLRSDTITQPTTEMRRAMAEAVVGDESRGDDPTTQRLEALAADITGHQAALFCTSGTMGNLVAFMTHLRPGEEVIAERLSHFLHFEAGGCTAIAGAIPRTIPGRAGQMDLDQLEAEIQPGSRHRPRSALIVAENTHNLAGGTILGLDYMDRLWQIARSHNFPVHLDGARVFNAAVALDVPPRSLTQGCDSVMLDLSKGLCAPYGSLLCGSADFIEHARLMRQRVGGGVRQIGHMAAAGIIALETMIERLSEDHANARQLAQGIHQVRPDIIDLDLVQTNIIMLDTAPLSLTASQLAAQLEDAGLRALPTEIHRLRFVTHRDVTTDHIHHALTILTNLLQGGAGPPGGAEPALSFPASGGPAEGLPARVIRAGHPIPSSEPQSPMPELNITNAPDRIGLNFIRPDVGRPGNHDFLHSGPWLVSQFAEMGLKWNRLAFSWVLIEPAEGEFNWDPYDRVVEACNREGIHILATLGGHFDRPPVPTWAGESLADVVRTNPGALERFIEAWVQRYRDSIHHWEMLNEPRTFHKGLTVMEYVEGILKPGYRIVEAAEAGAVLPCAFGQLPVLGDREEFWEAARGHYDIHNEHMYVDWGLFRTRPSAVLEEAGVRAFRNMVEQRGEGHKPPWMTEIGWWGTGNITSDMFDIYKRDPMMRSVEFQPSYRGEEILNHPIVLREDALRARWLKDMYRRLLSVPGCDKVFLWVSMDEFEAGYDPGTIYGRSTPETPASQLDLWGIISGDKAWRKSAFALQDLLRAASL